MQRKAAPSTPALVPGPAAVFKSGQRIETVGGNMTLWRVMWHVTHDTRDTHDNLCNSVTFAQIALATRPTSRHLRPPDSRQRRCGAVSANSNILQTLVQGSSERFHDTLQKFILRRVVRNAAWAGLGWAGWKSADYIHWSLLIHKAEVNKEPTKQIFINLLLHITYPHTHCCYIIQFTGM